MVSRGQSSNAACRVLNRNSCGSGSKLADWNGGCLIMTNAHVAGSKLGRVVKVEFYIDGQKIARNAKVIEAMYSDQVTADWSLLFCEDPLPMVPGVKMTKNMVQTGQDLYTRGCPRCVWPPRDSDVDITNVRRDGGVAWWMPDSIGGQSGSAVWDDSTHLMTCLLTWSWHNQGRMRGAGQPTGYIYRQQRQVWQTGQIVGHKRPEGLHVPESPMEPDWETDGLSDPELDPIFYVKETGIRDYPIWAEDDPVAPDPTDPPSSSDYLKAQIEWHRKQAELHELQVLALQGLPTTKPEVGSGGEGDVFGM